MNRLNDFLLNLANELIVSHANATEQDAKLSVQVEFTNKNRMTSRGPEDARALFSAAGKPTSKLPKQEILFWRAQLQWQADEMRMVLESRLSNVEVRVNTEREWAGCKVKRVDASEVEIKDVLPRRLLVFVPAHAVASSSGVSPEKMRTFEFERSARLMSVEFGPTSLVICLLLRTGELFAYLEAKPLLAFNVRVTVRHRLKYLSRDSLIASILTPIFQPISSPSQRCRASSYIQRSFRSCQKSFRSR